MKRFDRETLAQRLRSFSEKLGSSHISKSMVDSALDMPASATFARCFGSWGNALEFSGLQRGTITGRPQDPPIELTPEAMDIIEGELLGDGSLDSSPTVNACFAHSTANFAYSKFLYESLGKCHVPVRKPELLKARGGKPQARVRSPSNAAFGRLRRLWYPDGTKILPQGFFLNRTRCLFWYLGDGYVETGTIKFSTCGFTRCEVERLAELLTGSGFKSARNNRSGGYHVIRMSKMAAPGFLEWIGPCPAAGYEHKWNLKGKIH